MVNKHTQFKDSILNKTLVPKVFLLKAHGKLRTAHVQIHSHYLSAARNDIVSSDHLRKHLY